MGLYLHCRRLQSGTAAQADSGGRLMAKVPRFAETSGGRLPLVEMANRTATSSSISVLQQPARSRQCESRVEPFPSLPADRQFGGWLGSPRGAVEGSGSAACALRTASTHLVGA